MSSPAQPPPEIHKLEGNARWLRGVKRVHLSDAERAVHDAVERRTREIVEAVTSDEFERQLVESIAEAYATAEDPHDLAYRIMQDTHRAITRFPVEAPDGR